jgi:hypothetical protein
VGRGADRVFVAIAPDTSLRIAEIEILVECRVETTLVSSEELDALIASLRDVEDPRPEFLVPMGGTRVETLSSFESRARAILRDDPRGAARILGEGLGIHRWNTSRPRTLAWGHATRARALALAGGAADAALAREELGRAQALDAGNAFYALWLAAIFGVTTPTLESTARESSWPAPIAAFLVGEIPAAELFGQARIRAQRFEANWFVGVTHDRDGRTAEARKAYERCVAVGLTDGMEHDWAVARLASGGPAPWRRA